MIKNRVEELIAIKARREGRKLSRRVVAEETGLAISTVQLFASNKTTRYDADVLEAFCVYFDCEPGDLLIRE